MLFEYYSKFSNNIDINELTLLMTELRFKYEKTHRENQLNRSERLQVDPYDREFIELVLYALDDDASGTIDMIEWKNWILKGAAMENKKREAWARKDANNSRLDLFLHAS